MCKLSVVEKRDIETQIATIRLDFQYSVRF